MISRWKFNPWSRNAKAICERLESLIVEVRLAEVRISNATAKALIVAIQKREQ